MRPRKRRIVRIALTERSVETNHVLIRQILGAIRQRIKAVARSKSTVSDFSVDTSQWRWNSKSYLGLCITYLRIRNG